VPADISVIGFDDSFSELLTPSLTTITQPIDQLGAEAIRVGIERIDSPSKAVKTQPFNTHFVVRGSTAAPRGGR
jgi:DNA-binding LacI/PurR family transcriptional regulator